MKTQQEIIQEISWQYGMRTIRMMSMDGEAIILTPKSWDDRRWADSVAKYIAEDGYTVTVVY